MKVRFPDGTVVKGLALRERKEQDPDRDYGLYLDAGWRPTWPATLVDWEDFGLPATYETAAEQIREAFRRAKSGQRSSESHLHRSWRTALCENCQPFAAADSGHS